jgi:hypothetical protein
VLLTLRRSSLGPLGCERVVDRVKGDDLAEEGEYLIAVGGVGEVSESGVSAGMRY